MAKTDARVRYTQRVLKEALLHILREKPVNKITVKEVCELAQLNRATFYAHYSDCFALLESIENELIDDFGHSLTLSSPFNVSAIVEAIYSIIERHKDACQVLIFDGASPSVLTRMIDLAKPFIIASWRQLLKHAGEEDLEMLYIHLSNGMMHVVTEGYGKYSRESIIRFVDRIVSSTLALYI